MQFYIYFKKHKIEVNFIVRFMIDNVDCTELYQVS